MGAGAIVSSTKVTGAVAGFTYTAPSNGYAIVNVHASNGAGSALNVTIGGEIFAAIAGGGSGTFNGVYVGPGQNISGTGLLIYISGVEFSNSP